MALNLRYILRSVLGTLARLVLAKHNPDIIVVTGNGQTSLVREYLYTLLYEKFPVRRNIEMPEAEFAIPLCIFGNYSYPRRKIGWFAIVIKVFIQLIKVKPYKHILIVEISFFDPYIINYWMAILRPKFKVSVKPEIDFTNITNSKEILLSLIADIQNSYSLDQQYVDTQLTKTSLPISRIKIVKGKNKSLVVDARHYYFPAPLKSVVEIVSALEGNTIIFTNIENDLSIIQNLSLSWKINPTNYKPNESDVIILRGQKVANRNLSEYLL